MKKQIPAYVVLAIALGAFAMAYFYFYHRNKSRMVKSPGEMWDKDGNEYVITFLDKSEYRLTPLS